MLIIISDKVSFARNEKVNENLCDGISLENLPVLIMNNINDDLTNSTRLNLENYIDIGGILFSKEGIYINFF